MSFPISKFLVVARFLKLLAIALWLGGFAFFGAVAAPSLFRVARAENVPTVAPQMVGMMLERFSVVTLVCSALLVGVWLWERFGAKQRGRNSLLQGILIFLVVAVGLYLGRVLLPQTVRAQDPYLPIFAKAERGEILSASEAAERAKFDAGHKLYNRLGALSLWSLVALLALVACEQNGPILRERGEP